MESLNKRVQEVNATVEKESRNKLDIIKSKHHITDQEMDCEEEDEWLASLEKPSKVSLL